MRALLIFALGLLATSVSTAGQLGPARDTRSPAISGTGVVRGRVAADDGGHALMRARVRLSVAGSRQAIEPILTDAAGRFEFSGLAAGRYTITITKTGYVWGRLGTQDVERSTAFELAGGAVLEGLDVRMLKAAAISGRIVDDLGDPVLAASVSVGTLQRVNGQLRLAATRGTITDDRGEFRVGGLSAGTYVVSVGGDVAGRSLPGAPEEWRRATTWGTTYFPDAMELASAQRITLETGEELSGIDFILRPVAGAGARLTVLVTNAAGNPATGRVQFVGRSLSGSVSLQDGRARTPTPLEPGELLVWVRGEAGNAVARVIVGADDAVVNLVLAKGGRMTGRVTVDGGGPWSGPPPLTARSTFRGTPGFANESRTLRVNRDGTFEVTNLIGQVEFSVSGAERRWSVTSVTHEGRSLLDTPFEFSGGEELAGVHVVISNQSAEVSGAVVDARGAPAVGCFALIFPDHAAALQSGRLTRRVRSDLQGRFQIPNLLPGAYFAIATAKVDPIDWSTPEYLTALRASATRIELAAGGKTSVTLECGGRP